MQLLINKKAKLDYKIENTITAGIILSGGEVKSLRLKHGSLSGSYVKIIGNELFLVGAQINPYKFADNREYDPKRSRKLLIKKKEIEQLVVDVNEKKMTLVPLYIGTVRGKIKLTFGIAKGLKKYEKKEKIKKRDQERDMRRELKWN